MARISFAVAIMAVVASVALASTQTFTPALSNSFSTKFSSYTSVTPFVGTGDMYADYEGGLVYTDMKLNNEHNIGMTANKTTYAYVKGQKCQAQWNPVNPFPAYWWLRFASDAGFDHMHNCQKFEIDLSGLFGVINTACLASPTQLTYHNASMDVDVTMDIIFHTWDNKAPPRSVFQLPEECRNVPVQLPPPFPFLLDASTSTSSTEFPFQLLSHLSQKAKSGDKSARDQLFSLFVSVPLHR